MTFSQSYPSCDTEVRTGRPDLPPEPAGPIRTCLFDMGNVLLYFSHERMCRQIGELCGRTADDVRRLLFDSGLQLDFERGQISESEFHRRFEAAAGVEIDPAELRRAGSDIFELNEPMPELLDALKQRGIRLVLLSNTSVAHFDWARGKFDVLERFDACVVSYAAGAVKPEPAIYEAALREIGCPPAECFYTDDITNYVEAGRRFGLQAETFTDADSLRNHLAARGIDALV
jgi:HAD superfamily hydrolase (TIGR01509 family)